MGVAQHHGKTFSVDKKMYEIKMNPGRIRRRIWDGEDSSFPGLQT